ncbi:hypothetical protein G3480_12710 [Thiorhodococcus mannitoliphagus]|uniref:Uncharacterized protein n=1 Tax=Thiorhodococcus mannitoliphagus TaxID=329406 RepID=A0A6P1DZL7_9GAMM|nr:hypothetical protein [Thiorhodococcus mannitoliphagus]NEX21164.1 hypothetical protein [Thiorhodococcus mannitoliphagus]
MLSFDAPSLPSPLVMRECTRPRFDGNLEKLKDWLAMLKSAGVRQSGPALLMALENLRKEDLSAKRRLAILSTLKVPLLKTCAGLPKPYSGEDTGAEHGSGVTLEQRLSRLMFVNLLQALHQFDQEYPLPSRRQLRRRQWTIRNIFRFANRQVRYAGLWRTPLPAGTWRDLHELQLYLMSRRVGSSWEPGAHSDVIGDFDPVFEYKVLLLLGFAVKTKESILQSEYFMDGLEGWAVQTHLDDPHNLLGRIRLIIVEVSEDRPARQLESTLDSPFRGWVLHPPYPYIHEIEGPFGASAFGIQSPGLALSD